MRLSYTSSMSDSSSDNESDNEDKTPIKDNIKIVKHPHFLLISSKDRSYTIGDTTFSFNVNLTNNYITNYKNIRSIKLLQVFIPNIYTNIKNIHGLIDDSIITSSTSSDSNSIRLNKIIDYEYISLNIDLIGSMVDGTNNVLSNTSFVLYPSESKDNTTNNSGRYEPDSSLNNRSMGNVGNSLLSETNKSVIYYRNLGENEKIFYPATKASIPSMRFTFYSPQGEQINLMDDYLSTNSILVDNAAASITLLKIKMTEYFSPEEYKVGDNILFNNVEVSSANSVEVFDDDTPAVSAAWEASQTDEYIYSYTTSGSGVGLVITITTDVSGDITATTIVNPGYNFADGDTITVTDPGSTSNTATYTVDSVLGMTTLYKTDLEKFINRTEGHNIVALESTIASNSTNLYNIIKVPFDYTINKTASTITKNTYNINYLTQYYTSAGTAINLNNQISIAMNINTESQDNKNLFNRLI